MLRACGSANRATLKRRMNLIGRLNSEEIDLLIVSLQEEIAAAGSRDMCVHDLESSAAKRSIVVFNSSSCRRRRPSSMAISVVGDVCFSRSDRLQLLAWIEIHYIGGWTIGHGLYILAATLL
jgi:hypothetical protein